ncbi:FGGY family carbohydrate kinase [Tabrizicola sp.]|uniref:xylulokinase n=1 Tax=Tabrizicola sp. TaxID=2005166 RepID=UPI0025FD35CA|nr:FGGY family carbohydrate kinase [Tabrizicola sp.]MBY0352698.1 hypothetical protein [Tabrizicola sp.]
MRAGYVGIDVGTSAVKVLIQDDAGRAIAKASRAYPTMSPQPGWSEQSPRDWWNATAETLREAISLADATILSVGLSGQLNGFLLVGKDGEPIAPAPIWLDLRAEAEAKEIAAAADFTVLTGNELSPICVLPKLAWFRRHRPELLDGAARILLVKDWILFQLTREIATDPSDAASTAMTTPNGLAWDAALLRLAGVNQDLLPMIRPSVSIGGRVTKDAAILTGLPAGAPVAVGVGDVTALAVGCGVVGPGRVAITLGTAGHVVAQATRQGHVTGLGLWRIPHAIQGSTLLLGLIMSGGLSLAWLRRILGHEQEQPSFDAMERLAKNSPVGSRGVTFLPFLEGVATPHRRPDARGAFLGLSSSHVAGDMVRAVMEGVAFNAVECIRALEVAGTEISEIRIAEGGAQSPLWCSIMAAAIGVPVTLVAERDTSAAGAALVGRAAHEGGNLTDVAERSCVVADRYDVPADRSNILAACHVYTEQAARLLQSSIKES